MKKDFLKKIASLTVAFVLCIGSMTPAFASDKNDLWKPMSKEAAKLTQEVDTNIISSSKDSLVDYAKGFNLWDWDEGNTNRTRMNFQIIANEKNLAEHFYLLLLALT